MAHMHYSGTGKMHSFRGLLANGGQDRIRIQGSVGAIAWRINKLELIPRDPGFASQEAIVQIWREKQTTVPTTAGSATVDFSNDELLAAGWLPQGNISPTGTAGRGGIDVIFDNTLFVRNIYVTQTDNEGNANPCNYYIELEEVKVSAAGMAQLSVAAARRVVVTD